MLNQDVRIAMHTDNTATLIWTAPNATDVSWLYVNGGKIYGPITTGEADRQTTIRYSRGLNKDIEIHDFENGEVMKAAVGIFENIFPTIKWQHINDAVQYKIYLTKPGDTEALISTVKVTDDRRSYFSRSPVKLPVGWNLFRVESIDQFGNESTRGIWPYQVFKLDVPVNNLVISDGSGSGLFDLVITP